MSYWKEITIIGLGSQGKAWAANLRDSGLNISTFLRPNSPNLQSAKDLGINILGSLAEKKPSVIALLIPDGEHIKFLDKYSPQICPGSTLLYAHGASLVENQFNISHPQFNHVLLAPKAIASALRSNYLNKTGLGAVYSVEYSQGDTQDELRNCVVDLAKKLGITAGPYEVGFLQEARADLFSEQSLLCGLLPYAARHSFEELRKEGIPKELAYLECWHEVQLIANAMIDLGPEGFFDLISPHALTGAHIAQSKIFDKGYHRALESIRSEIWNGDFFKKVASSNIRELRAELKKDWKETELQKTFNEMSKHLK